MPSHECEYHADELDGRVVLPELNDVVDTRRCALVATAMTTPNASLKQRLVIAFSSVLIGCAVGATMPRLAAQSYPPNSTAQRWEQVCEDTDDNDDLEIVNRRLMARGNEGFELVSVDYQNGDNDIWVCFKRPTAR